MAAHDRPVAARAVEGRVAARHSTVVRLEANEVGEPQSRPQGAGVEGAVHLGPETPLRSVGAGHRLTDVDAPSLQLRLERLEMFAGRGHGKLRDEACHGSTSATAAAPGPSLTGKGCTPSPSPGSSQS